MKTYQYLREPNLHSLLIPFPNLENNSDHELHDDCPVCQLLKQQIDSGEVIPYQFSLDDEEDELGHPT